MTEQREGEATWVCPWAWCKRNGGEEWCDKCELRVALAASQEKERLRDAVIATIDRRHWWHGNIHDAAYREAHIRASGCPLCKALAALDSTQTHGGGEK